ncbi:MAG TPA: DSD1 family PLP-dependent enzyme [Luteitalea sp.]|nr:DSD1 family PLP-dependent enzyme [Luteitalea sp.]
MSRRSFLAVAGAAAHLWVPQPVRGYTSAEVRARADGDVVKPGLSKWELDTPSLCLDLDAMERNVATMQAAMKSFGITSRPHAKTHKTSAIAKYQMQTGSIGICCAKLGEAEVMAANGLDRILMTTSSATPAKIKRAMAIRKRTPHFIQAVDYIPGAEMLSAAAKAAGLTADVVIDVAVGSRTGVPAGAEALALAQAVDKLPNLKLRGMLSYDGGVQHAKGFAARKQRAHDTIAPNAETLQKMKASGLNTEIFSGGGTGTYSVMHLVPGFTDVQVGSYVFMDMQYLAIGSEDGDPVYKDFVPSLTVLTTVVNNRFAGRLTTDAGTKALTLNTPRPGVVGEPGMDYVAGSDEFGSITITGSPSKSYAIGDKLEVIVPHCDPVVNEYDTLYGIRKDRVETVWTIEGRGRSQ